MRINPFRALVVSAVAFAGLQAIAQMQPVRPARTRIAPPQTPYTAEFKITRIRTLENGTTITHESTEVRAADSHGRTMTATTTRQPSGEESTFTSVFDPVAGTRSSWVTPGQQQVTVFSMHPREAVAPCAGAAAPAKNLAQPAEHRTSTTEDLGVETIEGVEARGRRTTITTPVGLIGNSEPLVSTHESWLSTTMRPSLAVREINDDPDSGRMTKELTSISLSEPDESVFQFPQGYEVVNREPAAPACAPQSAPATSPQQ